MDLSPELKSKIKSLLVEHEGMSKMPYVDTVGKITIGVGYNLTDRGLPAPMIFELLESDIEYHYNELMSESWFRDLNEARKIAIIDMRFNLGAKKFNTFKKMIAALKDKNYALASAEAYDSKWATQVGRRADRITDIIKSGRL